MPLLRASGRWVASAQLPPISITDGTAEVHRLLARVGGSVILSEGSDLSSRPLRGMHDREVDLRAGNMVEVVSEDVHGDRGDDLDDLLIAYTGGAQRRHFARWQVTPLVHNLTAKRRIATSFASLDSANCAPRRFQLGLGESLQGAVH